jgi:predicted nucleic acid-binding protein
VKKAKKSVYLDTSVPSVYFDSHTPERRELTKEFFARTDNFKVYVSELTINELKGHPDQEFQHKALELISPFAVLSQDEDAKLLVQKYLDFGLFKTRDYADALHLAIASIHGVDYLVSWNFRRVILKSGVWGGSGVGRKGVSCWIIETY